MAPISLRDNRIEELAETFVEQLTGFKKSTRNFNLSAQFAVSNFRYHRFLDVDSLKVSRSVKGVVQKFQVHSQFEKAAALEELCASFVDLPLDDDNQSRKSDAHYSLILLLLQLSDSPTHVDYQPKEQPVSNNDEDTFDWKAYLLDDAEEEILGIPHDDSGEVILWSDEDEDIDEIDDGMSSDSGHSRSYSGQAIAPQESPIHRITTPTEQGQVWLMEHITSQYWDEFNTTSQDGIGNCTLSTVWQEFQQSQHPFGHHEAKMLTEIQLVRETLWMLSGVNSSYVYSIHGNAIDVNNGLQVSHLSPISLNALLRRFASTGEHTLELLSFVSSVLDRDPKQPSLVEPTQTAQAFSTALSSYFKNYKSHLSCLQKRIIDHETSVTLIGLQDELKDVHDEIHALFTVYRDGIVSRKKHSTAQGTSRLLHVFYRTICSCDGLGTSARRKVALLLNVFLDTLRPFIEFIDSWVTSGELRDTTNEFFIQRNSSVSLESTAFWENGITLRQEEHSDTEGLDGCSIVPCFLQDSIKKILLAGKSVNLIQGLGKMAAMFVKRDEAGTLYEDLVNNLISAISQRSTVTYYKDENALESLDGNPDDSKPDLLGLVSSTDVLDITRDMGDPMLRVNLASSSVIKSQATQINNHREQRRKKLYRAIETCMVPVDVLFMASLTPLIQVKYTQACGALIRLLKAEYKLLDHLAAMRNFFLLEAGATMNYFYTDIFKKIRRHQPWQDTSYLNSLLQEALQESYPDCVGRLAVSLSPNTTGFKGTAIQTLQAIALSYKVPWPVSIVIDESCHKKYNQILLFLLTLKRAKWSLDELRFTDLSGETRRRFFDSPSDDEEDEDPRPSASEHPIDHALLHKMFILRFRLLHFVNNLHNYIMTRILHTTGLEFQDDMAKAKDFDAVVDVHKSYVNKVYERCLLSQKIGFAREAITKVLNVALTFQSMWDVGIQRISSNAFTKVETEFSKCNHFVVTFLENLVKRGAFPHLESLAYSLSMETTDVKKILKPR